MRGLIFLVLVLGETCTYLWSRELFYSVIRDGLYLFYRTDIYVCDCTFIDHILGVTFMWLIRLKSVTKKYRYSFHNHCWRIDFHETEGYLNHFFFFSKFFSVKISPKSMYRIVMHEMSLCLLFGVKVLYNFNGISYSCFGDAMSVTLTRCFVKSPRYLIIYAQCFINDTKAFIFLKSQNILICLYKVSSVLQ